VKNNLAVIAYTTFSTDSRVLKEAQAALDAGYNVDIYTLKESSRKNFNQFNFYDSSFEQYKGRGKIKYMFSYLRFFFFVLIELTKNNFKKKYKIIHIHNMPNFLVFSSLIPKLFGTKIILDIHDLMPEIYSVKFNLDLSHFIIKLLFLEERLSANFADEIISTNRFHTKRFKKNKIKNKRITEIINVASSSTFNPINNKSFNSDKLNIIYPSTLSHRLGIEVLIEAIAILKKKGIPVYLKIFGDGEDRNNIAKYIKENNLEDNIFISDGFISLESLSHELENAHLGIIPLPYNVSNDIAMPVKSFEYFSKKVCVVASNLTLLRDYFQNEMIFFKQNDANDLSEKIELLYNDRNLLEKYANKGYKFFQQKTWEYYSKKYANLLKELNPNHN